MSELYNHIGYWLKRSHNGSYLVCTVNQSNKKGGGKTTEYVLLSFLPLGVVVFVVPLCLPSGNQKET